MALPCSLLFWPRGKGQKTLPFSPPQLPTVKRSNRRFRSANDTNAGRQCRPPSNERGSLFTAQLASECHSRCQAGPSKNAAHWQFGTTLRGLERRHQPQDCVIAWNLWKARAGRGGNAEAPHATSASLPGQSRVRGSGDCLALTGRRPTDVPDLPNLKGFPSF